MRMSIDTRAVEQDEMVYSPLAILNIFNNALSISETRRLIRVRGVYVQKNGQEYNNAYYDSLRDESSDGTITLIVPSLIRSQLETNKTITFNGYITRRVVASMGKIDLLITITDLVEQVQNKYSELEIRAVEVLQKKVSAGYRDVGSFIKSKIINEARLKVVIVMGKTGIIDHDIKDQMRESIAEYDCVYERVSLTNEKEIVSAISKFNTADTDILVIARGGGDNIEIFDRPSIAEACIGITPYFLTAIGHKENVSLTQKVADKAFITPSDLGRFFHDVFVQTREELEHSKSKLIDAVTKQLTAAYDGQIKNLKDQVAMVEAQKKKNMDDAEKVSSERIAGLTKQIELLSSNHETQLRQLSAAQADSISSINSQLQSLRQENKSKDDLIAAYKRQQQVPQAKGPSYAWIAIVAAIIGLLLGLFLSKH